MASRRMAMADDETEVADHGSMPNWRERETNRALNDKSVCACQCVPLTPGGGLCHRRAAPELAMEPLDLYASTIMDCTMCSYRCNRHRRCRTTAGAAVIAAITPPLAPARRQRGVGSDVGLLALLIIAGAAGMVTSSAALTFAVFLGGLAVYLAVTFPSYIREQVAQVRDAQDRGGGAGGGLGRKRAGIKGNPELEVGVAARAQAVAGVVGRWAKVWGDEAQGAQGPGPVNGAGAAKASKRGGRERHEMEEMWLTPRRRGKGGDSRGGRGAVAQGCRQKGKVCVCSRAGLCVGGGEGRGWKGPRPRGDQGWAGLHGGGVMGPAVCGVCVFLGGGAWLRIPPDRSVWS